MKRIAVAGAILLLIFAATLTHSFYLSSFTDHLIALLDAAEERAEAEDWTAAQSLTDDAQSRWTAKDAYLHVLLRHSETDTVYSGFREVSEFLQCREAGEYSAANARLIAQLELLSEAECLTIKNIL